MKRRPYVGIVDYGIGNITSLANSLEKIGYRYKTLSRPDDFNETKTIILPGVGSFPTAMMKLLDTQLDQEIIAAYHDNKRIIGICLGMQLLANCSFEIKKTAGLSLIEGEIHKHPDGLQVGWLPLTKNDGTDISLSGKNVYFNHNYYLSKNTKNILYACQSNTLSCPAIIKKDNVIGLQFHPEKSQTVGLEILSRSILGEIW